MTIALQSAIKHRLSLSSLYITSIGGGSINDTYKIESGNKCLFCKINSATKFPQLFSKEAKGLGFIRKQNIIQVPEVVDCFEHDNNQILILQWIKEGERTDSFWKTFGEQLAALHRQSAETFGLDEDNYMGSVPQSNKRHSSWVNFFITERLAPLTRRCQQKGQLTTNHLAQFESLYKKLDSIFETEQPSLLHGDLWSGNFMCNQFNQPVLIDPAVYYGHRSVDLAMTTLFGGFRQPFYDAYHHNFPLPKNYKEQWTVCNLYPLLIHLYLFGNSYLPQIENTLKTFR